MDSPPVEGRDIYMFDGVLRQMGSLIAGLHSKSSATFQKAGCRVSTGKVSGHITADTGTAAAKQQQEDCRLAFTLNDVPLISSISRCS